MTNAREAAVRLLMKIERDNAYSTISVAEESEKIRFADGREQALFTALVYGVLERRIALDHNISLYLNQPLKKLTRSKGGFKTRDEALRYCPILKNGPQKEVLAPPLSHYWDTYKDGAYMSLSSSKQQAYRTAWAKLANSVSSRHKASSRDRVFFMGATSCL